jgi:type VI protein secretion system component Hcp
MSPGIFNITKKPDLSTTGLMYMLFEQTTSNNVTIEIEVYKKGETSPYFAYKLKDIQILALQVGNQNGTVPAMESYTLGAKLYGYNNIESNRSVAFNTNTASIITYGSF